MSRLLCAMLAVVILAASAPAWSAENRRALVVGNSAYKNTTPLRNPGNDAQAVKRVLEALDFDVEIVLDADQRALQSAMREFGSRATDADVALVYYSGHGIQVDGENFLVPIDAALSRERDLRYEALPLRLVLDEVAGARKIGLVFLDACRDNPLATRLARSLGTRSSRVGTGLSRVGDVPNRTIVGFATKSDTVAYDGDDAGGPNSPYAAALLQHLPEPDVEVAQMLRKVRQSVRAATKGAQEPREDGALDAEPFYFNRRPPNQPPRVAEQGAVEIRDDTRDPVPLGLATPVDPDGDALSAAVTELPRGGKVIAGQRELRLGDRLTVAELAGLTFAPATPAPGEAGALAYRVEDGRGGEAIGARAVRVLATNRPPVVGAERRVEVATNPLGLQVPTDPDGDALTVTVTAVPEDGVVWLGGRALVVGDRLETEDVDELRFDPALGAAGDVGRFAIEVDDGRGNTATAVVRMTVRAGGGRASTPQVAVLPTRAPAAPQTPPAPVPESAGTPLPPSVLSPPPPPSRELAPVAEAPRTVYLVADGRLLQDPTPRGSRTIADLRRGASIRVLETVGGGSWLRVANERGQQGYVPADAVASSPPAAAATRGETGTGPVPAPPRGGAGAGGAAAPGALTRAIGPFSDCDDGCPAMVRLGAGTFAMGTNGGDPSERPSVRVALAKPYAIGRSEVTVGEWAACAAAGGCELQPDEGAKSTNAPMRNVSYEDAQQYVRWLREKTGKPYRLPSEAEWEHAARGGTSGAYWWGQEAGKGQANCNGCGGPWDRKQPAPVDAFPANPSGLYGTSGGVAEWTADCWSRTHDGASPDGRARAGGACAQRVLRGGSWRNPAAEVTSASRLGYDVGVRYHTNGFRVARDLD